LVRIAFPLVSEGRQMIAYSTNEKASGACNTEGFDIDFTNDLNFATGTRRRKAEATQLEQLVLAGHAVHKGQVGDYLVCKYGLSHYCADFEELQAFARKLGVSK
jgi:hypothetical protein